MSLNKAFGSLDGAFRTRTFDLNGHTFKVKVPLTVEMEAMQERLKKPCAATEKKHYDDLTKTFLDNKDAAKDIEGVEIKKDDVIVEGRSLKELAKQKALSERRIEEMFKLLVPEEEGFDMSTITYAMIDEMFPFAIQIEIMEAISRTISPDYKDRRGK